MTYEITRDEAKLAGRMTDAIVKVRDDFRAAGEGWKAERMDALLDLPTNSILTLAKAFRVAVGKTVVVDSLADLAAEIADRARQAVAS